MNTGNNNHDHISGGKLDYDQITDNIFIGTNQCCHMGLAEVLKKEGITVDVSLEEKHLDQPFGVEYYTWIPIKDEHPPSDDQMAFGVSVLEKIVEQDKKVYVHCKNGHGRATTLVAAYFIKKGKTPEEAEAFIKSKRRAIHLQEAQKEALRSFYSTVNQNK